VADFYIDNDVAQDVAVFLFRAGYAATHTSTLGLQTAHDGLQLLTATDLSVFPTAGLGRLRLTRLPTMAYSF
jgi:hypothetical protein